MKGEVDIGRSDIRLLATASNPKDPVKIAIPGRKATNNGKILCLLTNLCENIVGSTLYFTRNKSLPFYSHYISSMLVLVENVKTARKKKKGKERVAF